MKSMGKAASVSFLKGAGRELGTAAGKGLVKAFDALMVDLDKNGRRQTAEQMYHAALARAPGRNVIVWNVRVKEKHAFSEVEFDHTETMGNGAGGIRCVIFKGAGWFLNKGSLGSENWVGNGRVNGNKMTFQATSGRPDNMLVQDACLWPGQYLLSNNRQYCLMYQMDANLVLYRSGQGILWSSDTQHKCQPGHVMVQSDGKLVAYDADNKEYWTSANQGAGRSPYRLVISEDGNLLLTGQDNQVTWSTNTWQGPSLEAGRSQAPLALPPQHAVPGGLLPAPPAPSMPHGLFIMSGHPPNTSGTSSQSSHQGAISYPPVPSAYLHRMPSYEGFQSRPSPNHSFQGPADLSVRSASMGPQVANLVPHGQFYPNPYTQSHAGRGAHGQPGWASQSGYQ